MAGMMFNAAVSVTPGAAPETLIQLETVTDGADVRILIHSIHIYATGNTPAVAPDPFYLAVQTDCNEDAALTLNKMLASDGEDLDTFVKGWKDHAAEPTTTTKIWSGALHEQGSLVVTFAPEHRIVIPGGTRMGLICSMPAADYYAIEATLVCEA
jgi:hypothetical protein